MARFVLSPAFPPRQESFGYFSRIQGTGRLRASCVRGGFTVPLPSPRQVFPGGLTTETTFCRPVSSILSSIASFHLPQN